MEVVKSGIKETLELIVGVEVVGVVAKATLKDGKVDFNDVGQLSVLFANQDKLIAAAMGLSGIPLEAKDLDLAELRQIVDALFASAKKISAA